MLPGPGGLTTETKRRMRHLHKRKAFDEKRINQV